MTPNPHHQTSLFPSSCLDPTACVPADEQVVDYTDDFGVLPDGTGILAQALAADRHNGERRFHRLVLQRDG